MYNTDWDSVFNKYTDKQVLFELNAAGGNSIPEIGTFAYVVVSIRIGTMSWYRYLYNLKKIFLSKR